MTVLEHLHFYACIRGVSNVNHNVTEVIRAVGLESFRHRMGSKLSGGNKRKLSLGIALMGNPTVLLLDEPSSGMDAASKRNMWKTLAAVVPGRSLLLTTHSMEEADALANRAGIMASRMLALGTTDYLRRKHGNNYHCHLVTATAPHTSPAEMANLREWILEHLPAAKIDDKTYHGQMRFSVPAQEVVAPEEIDEGAVARLKQDDDISEVEVMQPKDSGSKGKKGGISTLFTLLEENKGKLGLQYYSVSQTTLDQVFLSIVGKHHVEEENYREEKKSRWWKFGK
jgi:ABC-type multidrug transport system ATPase subunit